MRINSAALSVFVDGMALAEHPLGPLKLMMLLVVDDDAGIRELLWNSWFSMAISWTPQYMEGMR